MPQVNTYPVAPNDVCNSPSAYPQRRGHPEDDAKNKDHARQHPSQVSHKQRPGLNETEVKEAILQFGT